MYVLYHIYMYMGTTNQPKWEEKYTQIIREYERMKKEGLVNEMVIITKDNL
jgi:hypothetical protein